MKKIFLNIFLNELTPGKIYDVISTKYEDFGKLGGNNYHLIVNDNGDEKYYAEGFFRDLRKNELREEKLKELGL